MFILPMMATAVMPQLPRRRLRLVLVPVALLITIFIGLRYEVGGDWFRYLDHFNDVSGLSIYGALLYGDPGYYGLNWVSAQVGGGIYLVNFVCAAILMAGTVSFVEKQPLPWLALLVAVPYMLIVVGMGYSRQSAALGLCLIGFVALSKGQLRTFVAYVAIAALFHKSAVLLVPIAALTVNRNRLWTVAWVLVAAVLMYFLFLQSSGGALWQHYVEADMESQGGGIRIAMNGVPAVLITIFRKKLIKDTQERKFWVTISVLALICIPLEYISPAATDRVALYFIPLQLYTFGRLHRLFEDNFARAWVVLGVTLYYSAVLVIWLNFASHVDAWVPYQFMPGVGIFE